MDRNTVESVFDLISLSTPLGEVVAKLESEVPTPVNLLRVRQLTALEHARMGELIRGSASENSTIEDSVLVQMRCIAETIVRYEGGRKYSVVWPLDKCTNPECLGNYSREVIEWLWGNVTAKALNIKSDDVTDPTDASSSD